MSRLLEWGGIQISLWGSINMVDMYAKYGSIQDAWRSFNKMPMLENVSLVKCDTRAMPKGISTISTTVQQGILRNFVTCVGVLNSIVSIIAFQKGRCAT